MAETKTVVVQKGTSLSTLLTVLFVTMKLLGVIDWSWWVVFAPVWGPLAVFVAIVGSVLLVAGVGLLFAWLLDVWAERKSKK